MHLENNYYYFQSAVRPSFCDDIRVNALVKSGKLAIPNEVDSDVVLMDDDWLYKTLHPYIHEANEEAGWNFDWGFSESCQFRKYTEGDFSDWHYDSSRKLSVMINLSDDTEYEGGDLEIESKICKEIKPKGSIVVFPSFVKHRIKPVTFGTRYWLKLDN